MADPTRLLHALHFAAERHAHQRRKGAAALPYVNHCIEVALRLARAGVTDEATLLAAVLHDTVEDTATTPAELLERFGPEVAALVAEVTDDKSLAKAERKALQVAHAPSRSPGARAIKLADKTCNVRDVSRDPPGHWDHARRVAYLDWAERVVAGLRGAHPALEAEFDRVLAEGRARLAAADAGPAPAAGSDAMEGPAV